MLRLILIAGSILFLWWLTIRILIAANIIKSACEICKKPEFNKNLIEKGFGSGSCSETDWGGSLRICKDCYCDLENT